ncbi:globin domain-containing protein, partial [Streptomyces sp. NPDC003442]
MDAPTTTSSAGSDGSGGNSGDWGWFTPSRKPADDRRAPDQQSDERAPSRPVNPIRPVGTEADRRTPAEPAPAPGPGAGGGRPDDRRTA